MVANFGAARTWELDNARTRRSDHVNATTWQRDCAPTRQK